MPCLRAASFTEVPVDITISPTVALSDAYLVVGHMPVIGNQTGPEVISLGNLAATPTVISTTLALFNLAPTDYFTILGVYDVPNGGVSVGFRNPVGVFDILNSVPYSLAVPPGSVPGDTGGYWTGTESDLATDLETLAADTTLNTDFQPEASQLDSLIVDLISFPSVVGGTLAAPITFGPNGVGGSLTLVNFSDASYGGSVTLSPAVATPTPEPGSVPLLGAGVLWLLYRRRRAAAIDRA